MVVVLHVGGCSQLAAAYAYRPGGPEQLGVLQARLSAQENANLSSAHKG